MRIWRSVGSAVLIVGLNLAFVPKAGAGIYDQQTRFTFNTNIAIPRKLSRGLVCVLPDGASLAAMSRV